MKNKNEEGLVFRAVEIVLTPLAVAVRLQIALIRQTLYVAFVIDHIIAKSKFPRIRFKWKKLILMVDIQPKPWDNKFCYERYV